MSYETIKDVEDAQRAIFDEALRRVDEWETYNDTDYGLWYSSDQDRFHVEHYNHYVDHGLGIGGYYNLVGIFATSQEAHDKANEIRLSVIAYKELMNP